jgi:hypothetical protein
MPTTGITTPLRRDGKSDWAHGSGTALYADEIAEALGIVQGELPWDTNRGSKLNRLRHRSLPLEVLRDQAEAYVRECLADQFTDVLVRSVTVQREAGPDGQETGVIVSVGFDVINPSTGALLARDQVATVRVD